MAVLNGKKVFQFTLPRGERPLFGAHKSASSAVSIHAPAWGATNKYQWAVKDMEFQFTLPRGERRDNAGHRDGRMDVSIHAPAWGATPAGQ